MPGKTLYDKIWERHLVDDGDDGTSLIYIDFHLTHEVTTPQAFEGLRVAGRKVRRPDLTLAVADHAIPTTDRTQPVEDPQAALQLETLAKNVKEFGIEYFDGLDARQGIVHVVGPEQGLTQPGMTIVCGDSHTSTHGAFGALAHGIGTSEVEHVLATQTLIQRKAKNMRVTVNGALPPGITAKDMALAIIGKIGTAGGTGHVIEYAGDAVRALSMEGRLTLCNMTIEAGARAGLVAPDETTFAYLKGRAYAPKGAAWEQAVAYWRTLASDEDAVFDTEVTLEASDIPPLLTWGTSPEDVVPITGRVPDPADAPDENKARAWARSLAYMDLAPGTKMTDIRIDRVFIGSCTNSRIEDLRAAAAIVKGRKVADHVGALVVPGSGLVKHQAEEEGLDKIFIDAGFEWREAGCSMCLGMNPDRLAPGERCASTSNRNFEGRQGKGGRTHLMSPAMAAAAALKGAFADFRDYLSAEEYMEKFTTLTGIAAPLPMVNVDTDKIIPAQFLKSITREGLGKGLFFGLRYREDGSENPDFVLNKPPYREARILIAGENFGCGSSREHAPWALADFGIRCVIAPSFADIFFNNCFKNGILPIPLPRGEVDRLMAVAERGQGAVLTVDLETQEIVTPEGDRISFEVDAFRKHCLVNGLDDIGLTLQKEDKISAYEKQRAQGQPWLPHIG